MKDKCPNCASEALTVLYTHTDFECGSTLFGESIVERNSGFERFTKSHRCELTKLKADVANKDAALQTALAEVRRLHAAYPGIGKDLSEWIRHHDSCDKAGARANKLRRPVYCTCGLDAARALEETK